MTEHDRDQDVAIEKLSDRLFHDEAQLTKVAEALDGFGDRVGVWSRFLIATIITVGMGTGGVVVFHLMDGHPGRVVREVELLRREVDQIERKLDQQNALILELVRSLSTRTTDPSE